MYISLEDYLRPFTAFKNLYSSYLDTRETAQERFTYYSVPYSS